MGFLSRSLADTRRLVKPHTAHDQELAAAREHLSRLTAGSAASLSVGILADAATAGTICSAHAVLISAAIQHMADSAMACYGTALLPIFPVHHGAGSVTP